MRAPEGEVRHGVVECFPIELNDIGVSAFVVGVARPAFLFRRIELTSVESPAGRAIRRDVLMTIETLVGLGLARKRRMTGKAVRLELGMPVNERPRHDEPLQYIL